MMMTEDCNDAFALTEGLRELDRFEVVLHSLLRYRILDSLECAVLDSEDSEALNQYAQASPFSRYPAASFLSSIRRY